MTILKNLIRHFTPSPLFPGPRAYFWCKLVPCDFMCWFRDIIGPNRFGRYLRKLLFPPTMRPYYDTFNFFLDDAKANWILDHCVTHPHTWRALSQAFKRDFPSSNIEPEDQMDGEWLQRYCEDYLKVDTDELREKSKEYKAGIQAMADAFKKQYGIEDNNEN